MVRLHSTLLFIFFNRSKLIWRWVVTKAITSFKNVCLSVLSSPDVVFFIYLYQRWIYRVDPNRVNEFGTSGVDQIQNTAAADATPATAAAITDKPKGEKKND